MTSRRQLLVGVATSLSLAGCLGSGSTDTQAKSSTVKTALDADDTRAASDTDADAGEDSSDIEADEESDEEPDDPLPGFVVQSIELSYYQHLGIITLLRIKNESGNGKFEIRTEARDGDGTVSEADRWEEIPTSFERPLELENDDIWDLRNNVGSLTSFVIKGRVPDGEFGVVKAFSGEEFRERVGVESDFEDPDVSVEAEPAEEDAQQDQGGDAGGGGSGSGEGSGGGGGGDSSGEQTGGTDTGTPTDTGVDPDEATDTLDDALG